MSAKKTSSAQGWKGKKKEIKKTPNRKWLLWSGALVLCLGAGYFLLNRTPGGISGDTPFKAEVEETLIASSPLLELLSVKQTGIDFQNAIDETPENNILNNINFYNGGGLAVADINNDGLPDLYFISTTGKNRMYLNQGGFRFRDITKSAGLESDDGFETAVTAIDINADGFLDFYICRAGPRDDDTRRNRLFINNGDLTFTESAKAYGLDDMSASTGANFFDFDNDGDLDLYLLNYPGDLNASQKIGQQSAQRGIPRVDTGPQQPYDSDRFYRNDNGRFVDISREAGIWNFAYGLSVTVSDFNHDGFPDVFVGNDFIQPDKLYINNGHGVFSDQLSHYFKHVTQNTMGVDIADFDNDGLMDLCVVDMMPADLVRQKMLMVTNSQSKYDALIKNGYFEPVIRNVLHHNNGNGTFSDVAILAGLHQTDWSWSVLFADLDNDGLKDVFITNGYRKDISNRDFMDFRAQEFQAAATRSGEESEQVMRNLLEKVPTYKPRNMVYRNNGDVRFTDMGGKWMTMKASWSCGAVWADLDADGHLDLIVNNLEDPAFIFRNTGTGGNFLQLKLRGPAANPFAVGASVRIETADGAQYLELSPTRGIFSSTEHLLHFGIGKATRTERITIRWPDGTFQQLQDIPANQRLEVAFSPGNGERVASLAPLTKSASLFQEITQEAHRIAFRHQENSFNDFENYPLHPWKISDLGPLLCVTDIDGDGLDDFFVGNGFAEAAALFVQNSNGGFRAMAADLFTEHRLHENHGAVFFDFDKDGDADLFIVNGGAEAKREGQHVSWQPLLLINEGNGKWTSAPRSMLPDIRDVGMRVITADLDNDGFLDLVIGGRVSHTNWPMPPRSMILANIEGKRFVDVTASVGGDFERCGMVTDLAWTDLDGDGRYELIVVGEWMPVSVFKFVNNKLKNVTEQFGFDDAHGMWQRLVLADLDGDGDLDIITGNFGRNIRYRASADAPFRCYAKDFDDNGTIDPILTFAENGKDYPILQKDLLMRNLPGLKKRYLYASDYARAPVQEIWTAEELAGAHVLTCTELETCWWENRNGKFVKRRLPLMAQTSVVQGILVADFNGDGHVDILLAGNRYGFEVETGRCDAGNGVLLTGNGKGEFTYMENRQHGFWATGEVRDLALLRRPGNKNIVVVANHNGPLQFFTQSQ